MKKYIFFWPDSNPSKFQLDWTNVCVLSAIWLRICVFYSLSPFNSDTDGHLQHINYVKNHWLMPGAAIGHETWQPPLYYFITAILSKINESQKLTQAFSLATSVATVLVALVVVRSSTFLRTSFGKSFTLLIVCFLPQFVIYSLQIDNDCLAFLLAFVVFKTADDLQAQPCTRRFFVLTIAICAGLLTKGYFLVFSTILIPISWFIYCRVQKPRGLQMFYVASTTSVLLICGCIKYIQNQILYGRPFLSNLDFNPPWLFYLRNSYQGLQSIFDINIFKLISTPQVDCFIDEATRHSLPLVTYGTFWFQYFNDCSFNTGAPCMLTVARYLYFIGIGPAILLLTGFSVSAIKVTKCNWTRFFRSSNADLLRISAVGIFIASFLLMLYLYFKYDTWIVLSARLLFASLLGGCILTEIGAAWLEERFKVTMLIVLWRVAFVIGCASFFAVGMAMG